MQESFPHRSRLLPPLSFLHPLQQHIHSVDYGPQTVTCLIVGIISIPVISGWLFVVDAPLFGQVLVIDVLLFGNRVLEI